TVEIIVYETGLTLCTGIRLMIATIGIVASGYGIIQAVRAWVASGSLLSWEKPIARDTPGEGGGSSGRWSGRLEKTNNIDPDADRLAADLAGESRVKFSSDPDGVEFDAVSDQYIGQVTERTVKGSEFRDQAKITFEAAKATGRSVYYRFLKTPSLAIINKLHEYSARYVVEVVIEIME
ncbi:MAG TPA: restriction endonuclease fold toxin, partial [Anaerolineales bacterium]|nr:restriction endonuclease fold toxin [Anaerolineales bacterium]